MNQSASFPVLASFVAGILTFISPCVLPLIPAYISFITGASLDELKAEGKPFRHTFWNALFFVLGFTAIFTFLGGSATFLGNIIGIYRDYIRYAGGALVIFFGLHIIGVVRLPLLYHEKRMQVGTMHVGHLGPFLVGVAFAIGWTPCVGPILSSILILASTQGTVYRGMLLLAVYSLGLGVPLLLTAVFINAFLRFFTKIKDYFRAIEIVSGIVLILVGVLLIIGGFDVINSYVSPLLGGA